MAWYCNISHIIDEMVSNRFFLIQDRLFIQGDYSKNRMEKGFLVPDRKIGIFFNKLFYVYITSSSYIYTKFSKKNRFPDFIK